MEVIAALALLGVVVLVGLESIRTGIFIRQDGADYAVLRSLADQKLSEIASLPTPRLRGRVGETSGTFPEALGAATWRVVVEEIGVHERPAALPLPPRGPGAGSTAGERVERPGGEVTGARGHVERSGLFEVTVDVRTASRRFVAATYLDRFAGARSPPDEPDAPDDGRARLRRPP